jgi:dolichol-phosphate mannosyltransferase
VYDPDILENRAAGPLAARPGCSLAVVVPALNERDNVPLLVAKLHDALLGISWEVVFVDDDSRDGTADAARRLALTDPHVRCIQRIGRRGLSSACIEGALATFAPAIAVMDADLQHDERILPRMLADIESGAVDLAIGSRYVDGGGIGCWDRKRARISGFATRLSRLVTRADVADPMSGFFMVRRDVFMGAVRQLSGQGFKILLDLIASSPAAPRIREYAYTFRLRQHGESKLDAMVAWEYLMLIADKLIGHVVPVRFLLFAAIGALGVVTNVLALALAMAAGLPFTAAQAAATVAAMAGNFLLNNQLTYRDRRLHGARLLRGLLTFCAGCSIGAVANVGVASVLFASSQSWWVSGVAGALLGSVFNYAIASTFTWKR